MKTVFLVGVMWLGMASLAMAQVVGMPNPASFFCVYMGHQNIDGVCVNGEKKCEEWQFFRGECRLDNGNENPRLYLERKSGATRIGETMAVTVGIDSKDKKIIGIDLAIKFGGSLRLERAEMADEGAAGFNYDRTISFLGRIDNEGGNYEATLAPASTEVLVGRVAKGPLLNLVFKRERQGIDYVYFVCHKNSVRDSNIISYDAEDILSCGDNLNLIGVAGDADWSGKTDFSDLKLWKEGYVGGAELGGDFNGNGRVEIEDLPTWKRGYLLQLNN